jgi:hypothetical protein
MTIHLSSKNRQKRRKYIISHLKIRDVLYSLQRERKIVSNCSETAKESLNFRYSGVVATRDISERLKLGLELFGSSRKEMMRCMHIAGQSKESENSEVLRQDT